MGKLESVKEAAVCICVCCILCGAVKILTPSASFDKLIKLAVGAFLVCSLVTPVSQAIQEIRSPRITTSAIEENEKVEDAVIAFTSKMLDSMVSGQIESALLSENAEAKDIKIYMDILNDGSISISQAEVTLSEEDYKRKSELAQVVYSRTGVNVKFITEEE